MSSQSTAFERWLTNVIANNTDPAVVAAVNKLRQSLAKHLTDEQTSFDTWLSKALMQSKSVFTCSGIVELGESNNQDGQSFSRVIQMVFNRPNNQSINQSVSQSINHEEGKSDLLQETNSYIMRLPLSSSASEADINTMMTRIVSLCQPAKFGVGGEAVFDPAYRLCDQLAPDAFSTNFTPIDTMPNIIHEIMRVLCPSRLSDAAGVISIPNLCAELYKLNVYSTGGAFKSHRDTPRSSTMIGSLVVCLPIPHQGGTLIVRHPTNEQELKYDWALSAGDENKLRQLQWCAFYGDCEHEILPVTSGYRATLTYNLYLHDEAKQQQSSEQERVATSEAIPSSVIDHRARLLDAPFPALLRLLLLSPDFIGEGGKLGIFCHHGYAHTSTVVSKSLNINMLKGGDAVIYECVRALGLRCEFLPVIQHTESTFVVLPEFEEIQENDQCDEDEDMEEEDEDGNPLVPGRMGCDAATDITWLNKGDGIRELQEAHATYGNEPSIGTIYSTAALIIHVGTFDQATRMRKPRLPEPAQTCTIPEHEHPLEKVKNRDYTGCKFCWLAGLGEAWRCTVCPDYNVCTRCQEKPSRPPRWMP